MTETGASPEETAVAAARKILDDHSPEWLAGVYAAAVAAVVDFVTAYQARADALGEALHTLQAGDVAYEYRHDGRWFEGTRLDVPSPDTEFLRSVLDVLDLARARLVDPRTGQSPLDWVLSHINLNGADTSPVRTITEASTS